MISICVGLFLPYLNVNPALFFSLFLSVSLGVNLPVQVLECGEEKMLVLTEVERVKALAAQLVKLLRAQRSSSLPVSQLLTEYSKTFGYGLRLQDYDASTLLALLGKLCHVVKVMQNLDSINIVWGANLRRERGKTRFDWIRVFSIFQVNCSQLICFRYI